MTDHFKFNCRIIYPESISVSLKENYIEIFSLCLSDFADLFSTKEQIILDESSLSKEEKQRACLFRHLKDRNLFVGARDIVREYCAKKKSLKPSSVPIRISEGKPYYFCDNHPIIKFSISHSHNMIMVAFENNNEIGIDVEKIKKIDAMDNIADIIMNRVELKCYRNFQGEEKISYFYDIWVKKEAIIKSLGCGFKTDPKCIDTTIYGKENGHEFYLNIDHFSNYAWAVCSTKGSTKMIIHHHLKLAWQ